MLAPIAEIGDLAEWTGDDIPPGDPQAEWILRAASARVRTYTGRDFDDGAPENVIAVTLQVAARVWRNPEGYIQDTTGPWTTRLPERAGDGIYLTPDERHMLDPYRGGQPAVWALSTTRGPLETGTVYRPLRSAVEWYLP